MGSCSISRMEYGLKTTLKGWKNDFELGVGGDGQDTSRNLKVVLGPYVQHCPCEASEKKLGQKPESGFWAQFFLEA